MNREAPSRYSLAVGSIGVPEAGFERTLLIKDDEQVEGGKNGDRVLEKVKTEEEPRLAEEEADDAVVHRVSGKAVKTGNDEEARRINWG
jgi:phage terminase Nu1 subunit (DNA packaging protein)